MGPQDAMLRILATTDLHGQISSYDYYLDNDGPAQGLALLARLIDDLRQDDATTLVFDNGDFLQGNPMTDAVATDKTWRRQNRHPVVAAMNQIGYDAAALGNHEFNFGLDHLNDTIREAEFDLLAANLCWDMPEQSPISPWTILDRTIQCGDGQNHPIRIGVIGVAPPQIEVWDSLVLCGDVSTVGMIESVQDLVPQLKAQGADIIILLAHTGVGAPDRPDDMENVAIPLSKIDGVDALVLGHTHHLIPSPTAEKGSGSVKESGVINQKPVVMPGAYGSHLGGIDLRLSLRDGDWQVAQSSSWLVPASQADQPCSCVLDAAEDGHQATLTYIRKPIGSSKQPLHSYFSLISNCRTVQLVADAQRNAVSTALVGTEFADLPLLSAAAPFKAGGRAGEHNYVDLPAGPLAMRNIAELYLYPNALCALKVNGADIRAWLERSAGMFLQVRPSAVPQNIIDPDFPSYNFDILDGLSYTFDLTEPPLFDRYGRSSGHSKGRVRDLKYRGEPVTDSDVFVVATNSYRAGGGGFFDAAQKSQIIFRSHKLLVDVLADYARDQGELTISARQTWSFAPISGAVGQVTTGIGGLRHLSDMQDRKILSATAEGNLLDIRLAFDAD